MFVSDNLSGRKRMKKGNVALNFDVNAVHARINAACVDKLADVGKHMKEFFNEALQGPRTGRTYFIPELNKYYVASAPGEYPTVKFGHLRKSMTWKVVHGKFVQSLYIGTNVPYAIELEMAMRPFLKRGIMENYTEIRSLLGRPFA